MAAAFPFTVSTTGRLVFLSCFMKSPDRRRNVVRDWMSLVISSMEPLLGESTFLGATRIARPSKDHDDGTALCSQWHDVAIRGCRLQESHVLMPASGPVRSEEHTSELQSLR